MADMDAILGANIVVRRLEIRRGCHVTVIESGKFLHLITIVLVGGFGCVLVLNDVNIVSRAQTEL